MRQTLVAFAAGLLFGAGLLLSRMVDPAKVLGFLDIAGHWDPSLAFVMGGGVIVAAAGFDLGKRLGKPLAGGHFPLLRRSGVTPRLAGGAAIFGIGWGLAGLCPGPAITALALDPLAIWPFVAAMFVGIWIVRGMDTARQSQPPSLSMPAVQNRR
ncbi:MAG: hypothetical protein B7Z59_08180 [Acidiphilium sp. 37-67-22]|nr:MAG: hypothetical protein B7Z59_08180 [Acidiphilium sp. 37-67-22]